MIFVRATRGKNLRQRCWYDTKHNKRDGYRTRLYHVFSLNHVVGSEGESFWRLIVGPWAFCWGYKYRKSSA
jgi:hypothetical protein